MIEPPVFATLGADSGVTALLGASPVRLFAFGEADEGTPLPYCVWQTITGVPENYVGEDPDCDSFTTQFDIYAATAASARACKQAISDALRGKAYVAAWRGGTRDPDTKRYRSSFDVDWITYR